MAELDGAGEPVSRELSEVDLSDPEDVRAVVPAQGSDLLLHFGEDQFLARYRSFKAHVSEWRAQYPRLAAIDLRYEREVVLKMQDGSTDAANADAQPALTAAPRARPAAPSAHHLSGLSSHLRGGAKQHSERMVQ